MCHYICGGDDEERKQQPYRSHQNDRHPKDNNDSYRSTIIDNEKRETPTLR